MQPPDPTMALTDALSSGPLGDMLSEGTDEDRVESGPRCSRDRTSPYSRTRVQAHFPRRGWRVRPTNGRTSGARR